MSDDEVKIHEAAISSSIKKDFLKHDLSYQDTKTMQCLAGYKRNTGDSRREVRRILLENFNASIVAVGANKVAIVKRPQPQEK
jgi:hypothetical protein